MERVTISAALDSLPLIRHHVREAARRAGLDRRRASRLELAVDEIATNIVVHGRPADNGFIALDIDLSDDSLTVALEDTAPPYDPRQAPPPDVDLPLEERPIGGLGVYLAVRSVDRFEYERVGNRNRNIFVMSREVHA